jgi:hypothetical protein
MGTHAQLSAFECVPFDMEHGKLARYRFKSTIMNIFRLKHNLILVIGNFLSMIIYYQGA